MNGWAVEGTVVTADDRKTIAVQHSALPEDAFEGISGLASWHRALLEERREGVVIEDVEPGALGGEPVLELRYRDGTRSGLAAYASSGGDLHWVVAEGDVGIDEDLLRGAATAWLSDRMSVRLTALDVRVLCGELGLPQTHFIGAAWYDALPADVRTKIRDEVLAGLSLRGIVRSGADGRAAPAPGVLDLLLPVLDAELIATVSWSGGADPTRTLVIGARQGRWSILHDEGPGRLRFARLEQELVVDRVIDLTSSRLRSAAPDESTAPADEVRSADTVIVAVNAVRRAETGLESAELSWRVDSEGAGSRITTGGDGGYRLAPLGPEELRSELRDLLTPRD